MSNHEEEVDDRMLNDSIHVMRKTALRKSQTNITMPPKELLEYKPRGIHPLMPNSIDTDLASESD